MFRLSSWVSALSILLLGTLWITYLCYFKEESLSESQRARMKQSLTESALATAKQSRTKVRKDIWVAQPNHQRLQNSMYIAKLFGNIVLTIGDNVDPT